MDMPQRKKNRLSEYDYKQPNVYFITVCTMNRKKLFWENIGTCVAHLEDVCLSQAGDIVKQAILDIPNHYPAISVDANVIMPNHIHLLLQINSDENGRPMVAPTISTVVQQMKGYVSRKLGTSIWQKGFYDHVVRGEQDYREIWKYIEENPIRWIEDKLYTE